MVKKRRSEDGSQSGNEYTERETFGKRSEFQSLNGTEAEREAVGRGDSEAEREDSYSATLQSTNKWRVRGEGEGGGDKHM